MSHKQKKTEKEKQKSKSAFSEYNVIGCDPEKWTADLREIKTFFFPFSFFFFNFPST